MDKKPLIISSVVLVLALGGAAGWFFYTGQLMEWIGMAEAAANVAEEESPEVAPALEPLGEPRYLDLNPPFLVNFEMEGKLRYLQVSMSAMSREESALELLQAHMPHVRNNVLMILSEQKLDTILTSEAKETLRETILKEMQFVLTQVSGEPGVEAVYFTSFVMQ